MNTAQEAEAGLSAKLQDPEGLQLTPGYPLSVCPDGQVSLKERHATDTPRQLSATTHQLLLQGRDCVMMAVDDARVVLTEQHGVKDLFACRLGNKTSTVMAPAPASGLR